MLLQTAHCVQNQPLPHTSSPPTCAGMERLMLNFLTRMIKRKKKPEPRLVMAPTGFARGHSPAAGRQDPMLDPLNPLSPVSPLHPAYQADSYEPSRSTSSSCSSLDYGNYDSSGSYSPSDSSSSSDRGSSSSNCD